VGLRLNRVSVSCMEASGHPLPENHDVTICVGLLQSDLVVVGTRVSVTSKDCHCRGEQTNGRVLGLLAAAHKRKVRTYAPLLEALQAYLDEGRQVEIFPWVVGVRGPVDSVAIKCCLEFLDLPRKPGGLSLETRPRTL
jgi:hypothetical protein